MSDTDILEVTKEKISITEPSRYKVLLHNDNVTTIQFVVYLLEEIFNKSRNEAIQITLAVDKTGYGVAGVYRKEIAEQKLSESHKLIEKYGYPLKITMEKE